MGKKQHQKDKLYLTNTEWKDYYGGKKETLRSSFVRLSFHCCALSFLPFTDPCCLPDGSVYDKKNIVNFIKKYGQHPITGQKVSLDSLIQLKFHKNAKGQYHCPIMFRVFNEHSKIVAIKTTGNVFSGEAVDMLNMKTSNFKDLLSDDPFDGRSDVIQIQDPVNVSRFDAQTYHHVRKKLTIDMDVDKSKPEYYLNNLNNEATSVLRQLHRTDYSKRQDPDRGSEQKSESGAKDDTLPSELTDSSVSTGKLAASVTSTALSAEHKMVPATVSKQSLIWSRVKLLKANKAYLSLDTTIGKLNLELYAALATKTAHNFLLHCRSNYFVGCLFFRSIKYFVAQTGDPMNTGKGGRSAWPEEPMFDDEICPGQLNHDKRGVLSMANSGPNTNRSQFFITYRHCHHLDGKHTVFGRLVGGMEVLSKLENIATDEKDRPVEDVKILGTTIYVDPFAVVEEQLSEEIKQIEANRLLEDKKKNERGNAIVSKWNDSKRVGKYLPNAKPSKRQTSEGTSEYEAKKKQKLNNLSEKRSGFSDWN